MEKYRAESKIQSEKTQTAGEVPERKQSYGTEREA